MDLSPSRNANPDLLIHVSRRAMACEFEVCFPAGQCENGTEFALAALDAVETLEEQLSYFRPASQITKINQLAAQQPVEVEPWLFDLLQSAMRLYEETDGAYDVTSTPLWEAWGFARRAGQIPSDAQLAEARSKVGGNLVELDAARRTVRFSQARRADQPRQHRQGLRAGRVRPATARVGHGRFSAARRSKQRVGHGAAGSTPCAVQSIADWSLADCGHKPSSARHTDVPLRALGSRRSSSSPPGPTAGRRSAS